MENTNSNSKTVSVIGNDGKQHEVPSVLSEDVVRELANYIAMNRKDVKAFQGHSFMSCVEHIVTRGKAEITRQIDSARKMAEKQALDTVRKEYGLSLEQAQAILREAATQARAKQSANAA